jgi:amino acid permease
MTDEMNAEKTDSLQNSQKASQKPQDNESKDKKTIIIIAVVILVILALVILATVFLVNPSNSAMTEQIRDVFIIFMALESLIIGIALVVLIVQLSTLINLLQNEIRPIINSTNETVNTLKGTAQFLSDNLTEPVIKINQFAAMVRRLVKPSKK